MGLQLEIHTAIKKLIGFSKVCHKHRPLRNCKYRNLNNLERPNTKGDRMQAQYFCLHRLHIHDKSSK